MLNDITVDLQRSHWNRWNAETREHSLDEVSLRQAEIVCKWLAALGRNDLQIMDVGCGTGWLSEQLTEYGRVTAIDLADEVVRRARDRMSSVTFLDGDFMQFPLKPASFDVVVSLEVLAHVTEQQQFIDKLATILRPGGHLMLATQNRFVLKHFNRLPKDRPGWIREYTSRHELYKMVDGQYDILKLFSVTPRANRGLMNVINSRKVNRPIRALFGGRFDRLKERMGFGWTLMLLAQKKHASDAPAAVAAR